MAPNIRSIEDRLLAGRRITETGCWEWTKGTRSGYGLIGTDKKDENGKAIARKEYVHRVAYRLWVGDPTGLEVMHKCDNPPCFNPEHLKAGTHAANLKDMADKGRGSNQFGLALCSNGHDNWYTDPKRGWRRCRDCYNERRRLTKPWRLNKNGN